MLAVLVLVYVDIYSILMTLRLYDSAHGFKTLEASQMQHSSHNFDDADDEVAG